MLKTLNLNFVEREDTLSWSATGQKSYVRNYMPVELQFKLFDALVLPIPTYGCEIWGYENYAILEKAASKILQNISVP